MVRLNPYADEELQYEDFGLGPDLGDQTVVQTAPTGVAATPAPSPVNQAPVKYDSALTDAIQNMIVGNSPINLAYDLDKSGELDLLDAQYAMKNPQITNQSILDLINPPASAPASASAPPA